jgi:very-short-patch-repair endonuclease
MPQAWVVVFQIAKLKKTHPMTDSIHNKKSLKEKRKHLRNNGTPAEATLWNLLKAKQLEGRKFRRQHSIENFIVDFYCPSEKLAIELDGEHHFTEEGLAFDKQRDDKLASLGIRVIRIENEDVFRATEAVLSKIKDCFNHPCMPQASLTPPKLGGESINKTEVNS